MSDTEMVTENDSQPSYLNGEVEDLPYDAKDFKMNESDEISLINLNSTTGDFVENDTNDIAMNEGSTDNVSILNSEESKDVASPDEEPNDPLDFCIEKDGSGYEDQKSDDDKWTFILGHDELKKRVLKAGNETGVRASKGQVAEIKCSGRLEDGTMVDEFESLQITLGEEEFIPAFDLCIPLMYVGEVCELVSSPRFAYGGHGRNPDIPKNSTIAYEIELLSISDQTPYSELPLRDKIQLSNKKRVRGNSFYERSEYSRSLTEYMRALRVIESESETAATGNTNEDLEALLEMKIKCYNNLAAAQMKIDAWDAACNSCDEVLRFQPGNVKALYRKGKCKSFMGDTKSALSILKEAAKLTPDSKAIMREIACLEKKSRKEDDSEKELYQKMLGLNVEQSSNKQQPEKKKGSDWWKLYLAGALVAAVTSIGIVAFRYSGE